MWLYIILLVLGVPFGLGFLLGWLVGRGQSQRYKQVQKETSEKRVDDITEVNALTVDKGSLTALELAQMDKEREVKAEAGPPEKQPEQREERDTKNINTALYVASFLLVAAATLFIGAALPEFIKFIGVWLVVALFYVGGLVLHQAVDRLRPAAVAFVGTGLALLPFTGLAFYNYINPDATLAWCMTSALGVLAYYFAALQLKSQVIAYLTLAFIFSLLTSSLAMIEVIFVWYFVAIILLSALFSIIAMRWPKIVPEMFRRPIDISGQVATPLAIGASLFAGLDVLSIALVFIVGAFHYAIAALWTHRTALVRPYESAARFLLGAAVLLSVFDISDGSWHWVAVTMLAIGLAYQLVSLFKKAQWDEYDVAWLWVGFGTQVVTLFLWEWQAWPIMINLFLLMTTSALAAVMRREFLYGLLGVFASAALPIVIGYGIISPPMTHKHVALVFVIMSAVVLASLFIKHRFFTAIQYVGAVGVLIYLCEGLIVVMMAESDLWRAALFVAASFIATAGSYLYRLPLISVAAHLAFVVSVYYLSLGMHIDTQAQALFVAAVAGVVFYALRWMYQWLQDHDRTDIATYSAVGVLTGAALFSLMLGWHTDEASVMLLVVGGMMCIEGVRRGVTLWYDGAIVLATIGLQVLLYNAYPTTDKLVFTHWWAGVAGIMALYYDGIERYEAAKIRGILGLFMLSIFTGLEALVSGGEYQFLFLGEHVALLVAGLLFANRLVTLWGAIGISLALLWMLRSYTYLWLTLIALGLIGFAVWRLLKKDN